MSKTILRVLLLAAMMLGTAASWAQSEYAVKSSNYKMQISALKSEISAAKKRLKVTPGDVSLRTEISTKTATMKKLQAEKKVVDKAHKAVKGHAKATDNHQKADLSLVKAKQKEEIATRQAEQAIGEERNGRTDEQMAQYYDKEIDALNHEVSAAKKRLKVNPGDIQLKSEMEEKKLLIKTLKAKKKVTDASVKAIKARERAEKKLLNAKKNLTDAELKHKVATSNANNL